MIRGVKIRLMPTPKQEELMWKSVGVKRFAYNWGINRIQETYKEGIKYSKKNIRSEFNQYKKQFDWITEVSAQVTSQAFEDLDVAMYNFLSGKQRFPRFKKKNKSKNSFYVRYDYIKFTNEYVKIEKIGKIKYRTNLKIPKLDKYIRPACVFDNKYWYLCFAFEVEKKDVKLNDKTLGVDLGVKNLATTSDGVFYGNINKIEKMRKIEKQIKHVSRKISNKYLMNRNGEKYIKTKNIIKLENKLRLLYRRLKNIRLNYIHHVTREIARTKPSKIVMENLNVIGMIKNRHLSKSIKDQCFNMFKEILKYKCEEYGIEFVLADRFFPSSKTCSNCGCIKDKLKLSDRTFMCDECGFQIDRDLNAAINLARY